VENIEHNIALNAIEGGGGGGGGGGGEGEDTRGGGEGGGDEQDMEHNMGRNGETSGHVQSKARPVQTFGRHQLLSRLHVSKLDITDSSTWPRRGSMDVVIASDLIYDKAQVPACVEAVTAILKERENQPPSTLKDEEEEEEEEEASLQGGEDTLGVCKGKWGRGGGGGGGEGGEVGWREEGGEGGSEFFYVAPPERDGLELFSEKYEKYSI
jgi:hypothetical protein